MEFNYFDTIAAIIILMLGLKGTLNGFFKELFGLIGIIGGIFIASRVGNEVGRQISDLVFKFENAAAINFTGFLVTLAIFWLLMIAVGMIFKKLSSLSGLGAMDRVLGFVFGASKFFLIAAVIAHAAYNIKAIQSMLEDRMNSSILFPVMVQTGGFIMKIDPVKMNDDIKDTIKETQEKMQKQIESSIKEQTQKIVNEVSSEMSEANRTLQKKKEQ